MKVRISCFDLFSTTCIVDFDNLVVIEMYDNPDLEPVCYQCASDFQLISSMCNFFEKYGNVIRKVEVIK